MKSIYPVFLINKVDKKYLFINNINNLININL
jgi:hypothetical protein